MMVSITSLYVTVLLTFGFCFVVSQQPPQDLDARGEGGGWTNAYCMGSEEGELSAATSVVCPSWAPIRCDAIQEDNYCCTPSTYCARASSNTIGCCPWGQTCNPVIIAGDSQPQPLHPSTWAQEQTSTVYVTQTEMRPSSTVFAAGQQGGSVYDGGDGGGVGGDGGQGQQGQGQQYCSTLYAHGNNLPTTEAGTCGTILIANAAERGSSVSRWVLLVWVLFAIWVSVLRFRT